MSDSLPPRGLMDFSRPEYWSGQLFPSPGHLPTQRLNPGLPHYRRILYQLSLRGAQEYWSGQPIPSLFLIQESNLGLLHCRWILYQLSYQGSPRRKRALAKERQVNSQHPGGCVRISVQLKLTAIWGWGGRTRCAVTQNLLPGGLSAIWQVSCFPNGPYQHLEMNKRYSRKKKKTPLGQMHLRKTGTKCPSTDEWIKKTWFIQTVKYCCC